LTISSGVMRAASAAAVFAAEKSLKEEATGQPPLSFSAMA
jgi:hypothetical protein